MVTLGSATAYLAIVHAICSPLRSLTKQQNSCSISVAPSTVIDLNRFSLSDKYFYHVCSENDKMCTATLHYIVNTTATTTVQWYSSSSSGGGGGGDVDGGGGSSSSSSRGRLATTTRSLREAELRQG